MRGGAKKKSRRQLEREAALHRVHRQQLLDTYRSLPPDDPFRDVLETVIDPSEVLETLVNPDDATTKGDAS